MMRYLLFVLTFLLASCGTTSVAAPTAIPASSPANVAVSSKLLDKSGELTMPEIGMTAPDFEFTMPDGTTQKLSDLQGKRVIINFWATWCGPCEIEMPALQKAAQDHDGDVVILGVNKIEDVSQIQTYATEKSINFTLITNREGDISQRYAARNIPMSFFIKRDGTIGFRQLGVMSDELIATQLEALQ